MLLALAAAASPPEDGERMTRLTALYDELCLKAFPDDGKVTALMAAKGAQELSPEEVRVTMRDDPARGWRLPDLKATVWLEFPPFHACSVRWNAPQLGDLHEYRAVADTYKQAVGGFVAVQPMEADRGDIHIHAVGEVRPLPDKGAENLFVIAQQPIDPKRRGPGEAGVSVRFVHQIAPPSPPPSRRDTR